MVQLLLAEGAEAHVRTDERQLTCHHLSMMRPRDEETLRKTPELLSSCKSSIKFDAEEMKSSLMALHMAVRNRNFYGVKWLLEMSADKKIPVTDQLKLPSSGVRVYLRQVKYHPRLFTNQLTILGEAVTQYIQDGCYKPQYTAALLDALLRKDDGIPSLEDTPIDGGSNISILQLLSIISFPTPDRSVCAWNRSNTDDSNHEDIPVVSNFECLSLIQKVFNHTPVSLTNTRDLHGNTPLHYVCAVCEIHAIEALLSAGADPHVQNNFGLRPIEVLCWTGIFCGGQSFRVKFKTERNESYHRLGRGK
ncbi:hypothetical protein ACHAPF_001997 [Botrytis cinerea]